MVKHKKLYEEDDNDNENENENEDEDENKEEEKDTKSPKANETEKVNKQHEHHPIYDITSFPAIKLPDVVNPEKTLMPEPIWMKKGQKIISDITDKPTEAEMTMNCYHDSSKDDSSENHSLNSLRLDSRLIKLLKSERYESYFPVQKNVIPAVVRGIIQKRDIAVCAPTGSGKTLSYVLPICHVCLCLSFPFRKNK